MNGSASAGASPASYGNGGRDAHQTNLKDRLGIGHALPSARGSYSQLPFVQPTRPSSPIGGQFAFSTTLRRQSLGEHDHLHLHSKAHPRSGLVHQQDSTGQSGFSKIVSAGLDVALPSSASLGSPPTPSHHPFAHTAGVVTPSARFARCTVQETAAQLQTNLETGLSGSVVHAIRQISGPNEFEVASQEKALTKFFKQFYESPLILLLLGSAAVSAVVGNIDDAASITLAIIIVVTGACAGLQRVKTVLILFPAVGFVQEQRSEKSLGALNKLVPHWCHLVRYDLGLAILNSD